LRILTREINYIIERLTKLKNFVFADPLLPFGTIWEANPHCSTFASPTSQRSKPKLAKELQFCLRTRAKLLLLSFN